MSEHLQKALRQPFISATALAAGIHSAWSLGTMFSGQMPAPEITGRFIFWIVPAVLIAFAIDIGQISTSAEIRAGQRSKSKYATFVVLALATYYLQFIYIVHHMPALAIADGVALFPAAAEVVRNAGLWLIPALLPISTILYTFGEQPAEPAEFTPSADFSGVLLPAEIEPGKRHEISCDECEWSGGDYDSKLAAANALKAHKMHKHLIRLPVGNGNHHSEE